MDKQRVIVYVDGFNLYYGLKKELGWRRYCDVAIVVSADSDMIPSIELAMESGTKVFVYFPPFHRSNSLSNISTSRVIKLERYESRFRQCLLPDVVHLKSADFDLKIPDKWKAYQN